MHNESYTQWRSWWWWHPQCRIPIEGPPSTAVASDRLNGVFSMLWPIRKTNQNSGRQAVIELL